MRIWTEEQRKAAGERMKALWARPEVRETRKLSLARRPVLCPNCGESNIENFYRDKHGKKTNARCKECHKAQCNRRWHAMTSVEKHSSRVHSMYGITPDEYKAMFEKQKGMCAICEQAPKTKRNLHIDHCHATGKVRGLLCSGCNTGIGALKESPKIFTNAIKYLGG